MKNGGILNGMREPVLAAAVLVIALGVFLRFHALGRQSVWNDEAYTVENITSSWRDAAYQPVNNHPPFYFAQLRLWRALGGGEPHSAAGLAYLRANSAVWGSVSLVLFYFLARRISGPGYAAVCAAVMALSPFHLAYSQDARPYALAVAEGMAGFLLAERAAGPGRPPAGGTLALWGVWTLQLYTHYWGLFVAAGQLLYGLLSARDRRRKAYLFLAFAGALLAFSAWWPVLDFHIHEKATHRFELLAARPGDLGRTVAALAGFHFWFGNQVFFHPWPRWLAAACLALSAGAFLWGTLKGPRLARLWLAAGLAVPFLLSFWQPMFLWYRYPFLSYGAFVLCLAFGIARAPSRPLRIALILLVLSAEAAGCYYYFRGWQKGNARPAVEHLHRLQTPSSVLVRPAHFGDVMSYYDRTPAARVMDEEALADAGKRASLAGRRVLLLAFDVPEDPVRDALLSELPVRSLRRFPGIPLYGITVYELGP